LAEEPADLIYEGAPTEKTEMATPETKFSVARKMVVACVTHSGAYESIGDDMSGLKAWIDSKGIRQSGYPFCLFFDNPSETPVGQLRSEACIPVITKFEPEGKFRSKVLEEVRVAETRHRGPSSQFAATYGPFLESLISSGYRLVGPAREYYTTITDVKGPGSGFLIQQPIVKK